jgi:hypothetical protein
MASALLDQVSVDIAEPSGRVQLHATGSVMLFDGFLKLYQEDRDDAADEEGEGRRLPNMRERERLERGVVTPNQHFTQPPPRYSEASLVKKLEELGIGRPSTYASILQVLQDRDYVKLDKRRFIPEDRGRLVTAFLSSFFERYVEYNFTADLENQLDEVSGGRIDWKALLRDFWRDFSTAVDGTKELTIKAVLEALDGELGRHFFPENGSGVDPRLCPSCGAGRLSLSSGGSAPSSAALITRNAALPARSASTRKARPAAAIPRWETIRRPGSRSASRRDRTGITSTRRGRERREAEAGRAAALGEAGRCRSRNGARPAVTAARDWRHPETGEPITASIGASARTCTAPPSPRSAPMMMC